MGQSIKIHIHNRSTLDSNGIHAVENERSRVLYSDRIEILHSENGFQLRSHSGDITLKDQDVVITDEHELTIDLTPDESPELGFNETRAPTQSLSDQWEEVGLPAFMQSSITQHDTIVPQQEPFAQADPLAFLNTTSHSYSNMQTSATNYYASECKDITHQNTSLLVSPPLLPSIMSGPDIPNQQQIAEMHASKRLDLQGENSARKQHWFERINKAKGL